MDLITFLFGFVVGVVSLMVTGFIVGLINQ